MSFTESLKVEIESVFDSVGFKKLNQQIKKTKAQFAGMNSLMARARGLSRMREQSQDLQRRLDRTAFSFQSVNDSVRNMSVSQLAQGFGGFNGELKNNRDLAARAKQQIDELGGVVRDSEGNIARMGNVVEALSSQFDTSLGDLGLSENVSATNEELEKLQVRSNTVRNAFSDGLFGERTRRQMPGFDPGQFQFPDMSRALGAGVAAESLSVLEIETGKLNNVTGKSNGIFQRFKGRVKGAAGQISGDMLPSLQSLQMALLGVQFQLLSLAFIFGGLMGSALGAVGVFKILGNTLKMFFLPTALEILPLVLDLRDAILSVDEGTRKTIGRIFGIIAAISALGSIIAFVVNGFLAFLTPFAPLIKYLGAFLRALGPTKSLMTGLKAVASTLGGAFTKFLALFTKIPGISGAVSASLGTVLGFLGGLAAAFLAVTTVAKRFGKKVALVFGTLLAAIGLVVAAFFSIPIGIGIAIGAILGILWTFKDTVISIFMGIVNFAIGAWMTMFKGIANIFKGLVNIIQGFVSAIIAFLMGDFDRAWKFIKEGFKGIVQFFKGLVQVFLAPFIEIYKRLVGNSIFPDLVKSIIDWLFKLPSAAFDAATSVVNNIVKGIKGIGSGIWDAFKSVLPDFVVDALKGTGKAIGNAVGAVGDFAGGVANATGNLVNGVGSTVDGLNGGGENNAGTQTNVQQNNVNATVEVNDKEETPQETGRQFGQGLSGALNSRQSDIASGT